MLPGRGVPVDPMDTSVSRATFDQNFPQLTSAANERLHLFYVSCGLDDRLLKSNRDLKDWLKAKEIKFVDIETPGYAHVWKYWRVSLIDYAPRLFR